MTQYKAKSAVVKVSIGSLDGNRVARILRSGDIVPDGVAEETLEKLAERGLIEALEDPDDSSSKPAAKSGGSTAAQAKQTATAGKTSE